ncbi:MAG: ATP-dependent Clp protease ATP-binding subunit, partial [Flavobacteriaceae bacterium]|nr:ATP-dependent Clp protease ATP-binding subunit [Flavobacteriaceae bacterium]
MDENFSPKVKDVIAYSREEALRLGHDFIGTEHLMLGILRKANGEAIDILNALDVDLVMLRKKIEALNPSNTDTAGNDKKSLHLTKQAEKALKTTFLEKKLLKSPAVSTAHLLLCILRNENDPTTKLLNKFDIDYNEVKSVFSQLFMEEDITESPKAESSRDEDFDEPRQNPYEGSK